MNVGTTVRFPTVRAVAVPEKPLQPRQVIVDLADQLGGHELRRRGLSMRAIALKLDLNFKTVRRYLRADSLDSLLAGGVRSSVLRSGDASPATAPRAQGLSCARPSWGRGTLRLRASFWTVISVIS